MPFELLQSDNREDFVQHHIAPQLEAGEHCGKILDIYPSTQLQRRYLQDPTTGNPRAPLVFFIDFPPGADCKRLASSCSTLVQHFDIFRTVFVSVQNTLYQVVLETLPIAVDVIETDEDMASATRSLVNPGLRQPLRLGQSLFRIAILNHRSSAVRVVLRISHALYDGLSFEHIVRSFHAIYNGVVLTTPSRFAGYIQHMAESRELGFRFWRSVLQRSSMSNISDARRNPKQAPKSSGTYVVAKTIKWPFQARDNITPATAFTTACAIMLAKETGLSDLVFGRVVSGRQNLPDQWQNIVGPCTNEVPVRVFLDESTTPRELLHKVQSQYLDSLPFETLGFDEVKANCTDWPDSVKDFGCCTTFQNFEMRPESQIQGQSIRLDGLDFCDDNDESDEASDVLTKTVLHESPLRSMEITGIPRAESSGLRITVGADLQVLEERTAERMLEELCGALTLLTSNSQGSSIIDTLKMS
jgi:hypothetical protein